MSSVVYTVSSWDVGRAAPHPETVLPRGRLVRVTFDMVLPAPATRSEIDEWVAYEVGWGSLDIRNPLSNHSLEPTCRPTLEDTGRQTDLLDKRDAALATPTRK